MAMIPMMGNREMIREHNGEIISLIHKFRMSPDEALNLAAWLVVMATLNSDFSCEDFNRLVVEVGST